MCCIAPVGARAVGYLFPHVGNAKLLISWHSTWISTFYASSLWFDAAVEFISFSWEGELILPWRERPDVSSQKGWLTPKSVSAPKCPAPCSQMPLHCFGVTGRCSSAHFTAELKIRGWLIYAPFGSFHITFQWILQYKTEKKNYTSGLLELLKLGEHPTYSCSLLSLPSFRAVDSPWHHYHLLKKLGLEESRTSPCLAPHLPLYFEAVISPGFPLEGSKRFQWFSLGCFLFFFFLSFKDQTKSAVLLFPSGFYHDKIMNQLGRELCFFSSALVGSTEGHGS